MRRRLELVLLVLLVGCSTPQHEKLEPEQSKAIQASREAAVAREGRFWVRGAEFKCVRDDSGWVVFVLKPNRHFLGPDTYPVVGGGRMIRLDAEGSVISYEPFPRE